MFGPAQGQFAVTVAPEVIPIEDLMDVDLTAVADKDYLRYDSAAANFKNISVGTLLSDLLSVDGAGSGLDSDLLDGLNSTAFFILAGQAGGQTAKGGTAASENLTLMSTAHATKGKILFGTSAYDEVNDRLGIRTASPDYDVHVVANPALDHHGFMAEVRSNSNDSPDFAGQRARVGPAVVQNGDFLVTLVGLGYHGTGFSYQGMIQVIAAETWSATNRGAYLSFTTTPTASITRAEIWRMGTNGSLEMQGDYDIIPATSGQGEVGTLAKRFGSAYINLMQVGDEIAFDDDAADPTAAGRLRRNGTSLKYHDGTAARSLFNKIRKNSAGIIYSNPQINFIEGTNITITIAADDPGGETDVTIAASGGGGTPGGADTQVQFNDAGVFGGDDDLTWNNTNEILTIGAAAPQLKFKSTTLGGGSDTDNHFSITATYPSTLTNRIFGVLIDFTSAGSSSFAVFGARLIVRAGYTGSSQTTALEVINNMAGAGTSAILNGGFTADFAGSFQCTPTATVGTTVGLLGLSRGGDLQFGVVGECDTDKSGATMIGVAGVVVDAVDGVRIGGYFRLGLASPTHGTSAALIADNGSTTADVFIARDNATAIFRVTDKGNIVCTDGVRALNATDGFIYIPTVAGTPVGAPTAFAGGVAMIFDTTNNKLYIYDGGWISVTLS
jgi:hypothetical protein